MTENQPSTPAQPDPVALHMQAVNDLARCKAMLCANEPMRAFFLGCWGCVPAPSPTGMSYRGHSRARRSGPQARPAIVGDSWSRQSLERAI